MMDTLCFDPMFLSRYLFVLALPLFYVIIETCNRKRGSSLSLFFFSVFNQSHHIAIHSKLFSLSTVDVSSTLAESMSKQ